jgi:two-component system, OmpR family, KDP operon response regulator KdpE
VTRILLVEDDVPFARALGISLRARGYEVDLARSGSTGLDRAAAGHPDVIILDLGLPDMDGIDVLRGLRAWTTVPILVLSARQVELSKIVALDAGADDYVTKPFGMGEVLARLRALTRRVDAAGDEREIVTPDFTIDLEAKRVTVRGDDVHLTPTEWRLVNVLVRNPGKLVPQRMLAKTLRGVEMDNPSEYLRAYLARIRRKLEPAPSRPRYFLTETGMGYRFLPGEAPEVPTSTG